MAKPFSKWTVSTGRSRASIVNRWFWPDQGHFRSLFNVRESIVPWTLSKAGTVSAITAKQFCGTWILGAIILVQLQKSDYFTAQSWIVPELIFASIESLPVTLRHCNWRWNRKSFGNQSRTIAICKRDRPLTNSHCRPVSNSLWQRVLDVLGRRYDLSLRLLGIGYVRELYSLRF